MGLTLQSWQHTLQTVYQRSVADAYFRQKCLSDPHGAVKEAGGLEMPKTARFRFVERVEEIVYVLPPRRSAGDELTDAELDDVAGGMGFNSCGTVYTIPV
jgi:hypothetical protein